MTTPRARAAVSPRTRGKKFIFFFSSMKATRDGVLVRRQVTGHVRHGSGAGIYALFATRRFPDGIHERPRRKRPPSSLVASGNHRPDAPGCRILSPPYYNAAARSREPSGTRSAPQTLRRRLPAQPLRRPRPV